MRDLLIGEVESLTGISAGRIRHYEAKGLLAPRHLPSGYRTFCTADLVTLLHIDLLRSVGMGLGDIAHCLRDGPGDARAALVRHRADLVAERDRLDAMIGAVDVALAAADDDVAASVSTLAGHHRTGVEAFGRLRQPLSGAAAAAYCGVFGAWDVPIPAHLGRMHLPPEVTGMLEDLAAAPGYQELFDRLGWLVGQIGRLSGDPAESAALARQWVDRQLADPLPDPVAAVLRRWLPALVDRTDVRQGVLAMSGSLVPFGHDVATEVERQAGARGVPALGAIVVPADDADRARTA